jgi:alpha-mannosidase
VVDRPRDVSVTSDLAGPIRGRLTVRRTFDWPLGILPDGSARTSEVEATEVTTEVELRAGDPFVRLAIGLLNHSLDHRVRLHLPLPRPADVSHAEGQFAVVERGLAGEGGYREEPLATFPAHGWIDAGGLAALLDHLAEYELVDDGREMAVTILRSTGLISRNANPYRQDPAGPEMAIPNAQMRGPRRFSLAVMPHAGDWTEGGVVGAAERYRHALLSVASGGPTDASWPPHGAMAEGLALDAASGCVVISSLRRRSDGWLEARIVNLGARAAEATLRGGLTEAREANLRGEPGSAIEVRDGGVSLELRPAEIRTIQLRRTETASEFVAVLDASGPRQNA